MHAMQSASPQLTAAALTALLATPVELLTVAELASITDALQRVPQGHDPGATIGDLLT